MCVWQVCGENLVSWFWGLDVGHQGVKRAWWRRHRFRRASPLTSWNVCQLDKGSHHENGLLKMTTFTIEVCGLTIENQLYSKMTINDEWSIGIQSWLDAFDHKILRLRPALPGLRSTRAASIYKSHRGWFEVPNLHQFAKIATRCPCFFYDLSQHN